MRKQFALLLLFLLCIAASARAAESVSLSFQLVPDVIRPGKYYDIRVRSSSSGTASLLLSKPDGTASIAVLSDYPLSEGDNVLTWDGLRGDQLPVESGDYLLRLVAGDGSAVESPVRIGAPYPLITNIFQSDSVFSGEPIQITYDASEPGTLEVTLQKYGDSAVLFLSSLGVQEGENVFEWNGDADNAPVADGVYALQLSLRTPNGAESLVQSLYLEVSLHQPEETAEPQASLFVDSSSLPQTEPDPTPEPAAALPSPPYSTIDDGTFWAMHPGETDEAKIWDVLMQPIVVYDGGLDAKPKVHAWMMENPDGTGAKIAQLHAQSQGLHVVGEPNEFGYVLVEAFSNYDEDYNPKTEDEIAHAYDLKRGYVLAKNLKTVEVMPDMALLIDKKTQRMYLYKDGVRVTELLIATGRITDGKYYNETIPGEYITVSHTGMFSSGNMFCDMAIRINGGILLHEVPFKENRDGTRNYSAFEGYLGTKQSHGCIRIQRLKNPDGYNMKWIWNNFRRAKPYKVIIWDDLNRLDNPSTWYPNPKN